MPNRQEAYKRGAKACYCLCDHKFYAMTIHRVVTLDFGDEASEIIKNTSSASNVRNLDITNYIISIIK